MGVNGQNDILGELGDKLDIFAPVIEFPAEYNVVFTILEALKALIARALIDIENNAFTESRFEPRRRGR